MGERLANIEMVQQFLCLVPDLIASGHFNPTYVFNERRQNVVRDVKGHGVEDSEETIHRGSGNERPSVDSDNAEARDHRSLRYVSNGDTAAIALREALQTSLIFDDIQLILRVKF